MDKRAIPKRLDDFAEEWATKNKPASAWMDEFRRARRKGQLKVMTLNGKRGGVLYSDDYHMTHYRKTAYLLELSPYE